MAGSGVPVAGGRFGRGKGLQAPSLHKRGQAHGLELRRGCRAGQVAGEVAGCDHQKRGCDRRSCRAGCRVQLPKRCRVQLAGRGVPEAEAALELPERHKGATLQTETAFPFKLRLQCKGRATPSGMVQVGRPAELEGSAGSDFFSAFRKANPLIPRNKPFPLFSALTVFHVHYLETPDLFGYRLAVSAGYAPTVAPHRKQERTVATPSFRCQKLTDNAVSR